MTEILENLYYMVDDWAEGQYWDSEEAKALRAQRDALRDEIILRLGGDGEEMLEALADLSLRLEDLRGLALFRASMGLGAQIARPDGAYSTSR